jgi:MoaA/NifB/PqqE/SkfB family radical SAM enzyme
MDRVTERAAAARVPLYGMLELTWRCNFRCVHCYQEGLRHRHRELSTNEWTALIDELEDLGCAFLTLTGGEALLRPDFGEIYGHAFDRGFVVTVFTNGSLVGEDVLELWARKPPRKVELTLYGMSAEKYAEVTGQPEGFLRALTAVERLVQLGVRVELKAPAMRPLMEDLPAMAAYAKARGLSFRTDAGLFPRLDGNRAPLAYRLSPAEVVALHQQEAGFDESLSACFAEVPDLGNKVYRCGAGSNAFNVDPSGHFEACAISRATSLDWRAQGAAQAWESLAAEAARVHAAPAAATLGGPGTVEDCGACAVRGGCSRCPGKSWLEAGAPERAVPHHCDISQAKQALWRNG